MGIIRDRLQTSGLCRLDRCNNSERSSRKFIKTNEAPYQMLGHRTFSTLLGYKELSCTHFWLSLLSECLSSYLYVFIVCSTRISWTGSLIGHEPNLLAMSLASGIAMMLLIFTFRTVHVNPALTVSFLLTGRIPIIRALAYVMVHCVGAIAAVVFLFSVSIKGHAGALGLDNPHESLLAWQILIVEIVISFVVTLATYATCNYSSYASAKRFIHQQLGQNSSQLWSTCDTESAPNNKHMTQSLGPIVPHFQSTSITLLQDGQTDMSLPHNQQEDRANQPHIRPYLISNHYNQVYDECNDATAKSQESQSEHIDNVEVTNGQRSSYRSSEFNQRRFNNKTMKNISSIPNQFSNNSHTISGQLAGNNNPCLIPGFDKKRNLPIDPTSYEESDEARFLAQVVDGGYSNCLGSSNNPSSSSGAGSNSVSFGFNNKPLVGACEYNSDNNVLGAKPQNVASRRFIHEDSINYDYDYDNHRIYATQLKSESAGSQIPIEEIMQDECQLLAPNGFSLHVTSGQALTIGLAYALTSLCGIPASGASLNPARSLGPAFIMNRWDRLWIYWVGPILGSVIAGFFYEFVFSPTRSSSLCYRPKLFRLSAQDMAKVGAKSRLYQQRAGVAPIPPQHTNTAIYRPNVHHSQSLHSPTMRASHNQTIAAPLHHKPSSSSTMVHHLQPPFEPNSNIENLNFMQNHQRHQFHDRIQATNFDRSKSTTIINSLSAQQQQIFHQNASTNLPVNRNNGEFGKFSSSKFGKTDSSIVVSALEPTFSEL